jgi:hypothetical protein
MAIGYVIYRVCRGNEEDVNQLGSWSRQLVVTEGLSLLPDVDIVPGILLGDIGRFHNNLMSSLLAGLATALGVGGLAWWRTGRGFKRWSLIALVCYYMHLLMDYLTVGGGIMLLWPFSWNRHVSPVTLFYGLRWSDGLTSKRHLRTLVTEIGLVALPILLFALLKRRSLKDQPLAS